MISSSTGTHSQTSRECTFPMRLVVPPVTMKMLRVIDTSPYQVGIRLEDSFYIDESGNGVYFTENVGGQATSPWQP